MAIVSRLKPKFNHSNKKSVDDKISVCQECRFGIFKSQKNYTFVRDKGLVHDKCIELSRERQDEI
jgi:hypothetical protein